MYFLLSIACLLSTVHVDGLRTTFFSDDATYNPCGTNPGVYYYPDPKDNHNYYQCDEFGNAYLLSCGELLVWDEVGMACSWPLVATSPSSKILFDDATYNPCGTNPGVYFYPDPVDNHNYYQCDESGNAYLLSCGKSLVWDEIGVACSWPPVDTSPPPKINPTDTTTSSPWPTTTWPSPTPSWPTTTSTWPTTTPSWPTVTPSWPTTTTGSSSTTIGQVSSLCAPINPCGKYGECIESPITVPSSARRFACICSENWFGRLCDKNIAELTTPTPTSPMISDQNNNISGTTDSFSLPAKTEKDSKYLFYGLKAGDPSAELSPKKKRQLIRKL